MEASYLLWLQGLRESVPALLNQFFVGVSALVASPLPIVICAIIFWCVNKRGGYLMVAGYMFCYTVNQTVKNIACIYRPWILDSRIVPDAAAVSDATGYSFPSGHTSIATGIAGAAVIWQRARKWLVALLVVFVVLVAFSRNWLGCHMPKDTVVALVLSCVVLALICAVRKFLENHPNGDIPIAVAGIVISGCLLAFLALKGYPIDYDANGKILADPFAMQTDCFKALGGSIGFFVSWILERRFIKFSVEGSLKTRILRGVVGIVIVGAVYVGVPLGLNVFLDTHWAHFFKYLILFLVAVAAYPACFTAFEHHRYNRGSN